MPTIPPIQGFLAAPAAAASALPIAARAGRALAGVIRTTTGKVSKVVLPSGATFSRKKAASLIRRFGMDVAATALGITLVEAAEILLTEASAPRRRRGISGRDIQNAKRVACTVARMARDLNVKPAPQRRRAASCR